MMGDTTSGTDAKDLQMTLSLDEVYDLIDSWELDPAVKDSPARAGAAGDHGSR